MQSKIMDNWAYMRLNADLISASLFKGDTRLIWLPGTLSINENCLWIAARCCPLLPDAEATALRQSCGYGIGQMIGHRSSMRQIGPKSSLTSANRASNCTQMLAIKTHFTSFLKGKQNSESCCQCSSSSRRLAPLSAYVGPIVAIDTGTLWYNLILGNHWQIHCGIRLIRLELWGTLVV